MPVDKDKITNPKPGQQRALLEACANLVAFDRLYRRTQQAWMAEPQGSPRHDEVFREHEWALREWSRAIAEVRRAARAYTRYTRRQPKDAQDAR